MFDDEDKLRKKNGIILIPDLDEELKMRLLIVSHFGSMGHHGGDATNSVLKEMFVWNNMDRDAEKFVSQCHHCILTRSADRWMLQFTAQSHMKCFTWNSFTCNRE